MTSFIKGGIATKTLTLLVVCATLFSFSPFRGAHSFRILLNNKLILEQYVAAKEGVKNFDLSKASPADQLSIYYNECGKLATGRSISIRDEHNKVLKEWKFTDAFGDKSAMTCKAGDILSLQKNKNGKLQLYYSSKVLPDGQLLAAIVTADKTTASR